MSISTLDPDGMNPIGGGITEFPDEGGTTPTEPPAPTVTVAAFRHGGVRPVSRRYQGRSLASLEAEFRAMERS